MIIIVFVLIIKAPEDFRATTIFNVLFDSSEDIECVEFDIIDDDIALEDDEQFMVTFTIQSSDTTAVPGDVSSSTVTIVDDDGNNVVIEVIIDQIYY